MQRISSILETPQFKNIFNVAIDQFRFWQHKAYFQWAMENTKPWSDSFAFWCTRQPKLTTTMISCEWELNKKYYLNQDLHDNIDKSNDDAKRRKREKEDFDLENQRRWQARQAAL